MMDFGAAFRWMFYALFGAGLLTGAVIFWLVPKLWHWLKPLIHAVSA